MGQDEIEALTNSISSLRETVSTSDGKNGALQTDLQQQLSLLDEANAALAKSEEEQQRIQEEYNSSSVAAESRAAELRLAVTEMTERLGISEELNARERKELRDDIAGKRKELNEASSFAVALSTQLEHLQSTSDEIIDARDEAVTDLERMEAYVREMRESTSKDNEEVLRRAEDLLNDERSRTAILTAKAGEMKQKLRRAC